MLFLVFHLGADRYAIPAKNIHEVVPLASLRLAPQAPEGIAGILNYHGNPVPVADLAQIVCGRKAALTMHTRIILVSSGDSPVLGLIAENATDFRRFDETAFQPSGVKAPSHWLGKVASDGDLIQWIHAEEIFPPDVLAAIAFPEEKPAVS